MSEEIKKKESSLPPYITVDVTRDGEPNYKELYFKLLTELESVIGYVRMVQNKSVKELNKNFKPRRANIK